MKKVYELRKEGWKVRCLHYRKSRVWKQLQPTDKYAKPEFCQPLVASYKLTDTEILPNGGLTIVQIKSPDNIEAEGTAMCSDKDAYNRKLGVRIALARAMENLQVGIKPVQTELTKKLQEEHQVA